MMGADRIIYIRDEEKVMIMEKQEKTEAMSIAVLSNTDRYSIFSFGDKCIKFKTSPYLERYLSVSKWDNGYIVCNASYSTIPEPVEEYIDLRFIAERLRLPKDVFHQIKEVKVQ